MSKIRINELARELEVKPNVILETLAELGIADKKTHSSSLDDDVALQVRQRVTGESGGFAPVVSHGRERVEESASTVEAVHSQPASHAQPSSHPQPLKPHASRVETAVAETSVKDTPAIKTVEEAPAPPVRLAPPLRPPLSSGQSFSPP
jgi:translation initiation factor IF-2